MVHGFEKRDIFNNDRERSMFLDRLSQSLLKTETKCLGWAFMTNHAHLLLLPTKGKLAELMRRLLTSEAKGVCCFIAINKVRLRCRRG
jgi:putative transposase